MPEHCPRDSAGFCRLGLMATSACGAREPGEPAGKVRCPRSADEAHQRLVATAQMLVDRQKAAASGGAR